MPERRTIAVATAAVAVLAVLVAVLLTASDDSGVGRLRSSLGNAADSVGNAISAPSTTPTPTPAPPTTSPEQVRSRTAADSVRGLLVSANAALDRGDNASRVLALRDYDRIRLAFTDILAEDDYNGLLLQAQQVQKRLEEKPVRVPRTAAPQAAG